MASHQLAIAKASFSAGLLRPDPTLISRDEITHFHSLLEKAISQCSPTNIQNCKQWLLRNVLCSPARITALGKYLAAFSASFAGQVVGAPGSMSKPSPKRKRLHVLYLLNDLLYHTKFHDGASSAYSSLTAKLQPYLVDLFGAAASFRSCWKHQRKIESLLDLWEANGYYSRDYIGKLREAVRIAASTEPASSNTTTGVQGDGDVPRTNKATSGKDAPFVMPAVHGDLSVPYYDLPAGNLMPHIMPNSVAPINSPLVKPLQFVAGPADEKIAMAVKNLLRDVEKIFGDNGRSDGGVVRDVDELGLPILRGEGAGEPTGGDGYYGWSKAFCEKMKGRRKKKSRGQGRQGRSKSRSESLTPRKRRRYSYSDSSRSRSRGRSPSYSGSRSVSNERYGTLREGKNSLPSKPRVYSPRSRSPSERYQRDRSLTRSRSRSRSYSPPSGRPNFLQPYPGTPNVSQPESFQSNQAPPPPPPPQPSYPVQYQQGLSQLTPPTGPRGMPIPPHPSLQSFHGQHPIGYSGPWPPPPPPPPNISFYQQGGQYPLQQGYPPPPPLPWSAQQTLEGGTGGYGGHVYQGSPATSQQQQQQNNGQGFDDYRSVKGREIGARRGWKT